MAELEKVIKGLQRCTGEVDCDRETHHNYCPYWNNGCFEHLIRDALSLLKEQEPRVLQLNEIHRGMTVWLEDIDKSEILLAIGGASCHYAKTFITENDRSIAAKDSEYNIRWRAWTSWPTDEQREAVKWDD